MDGLSVAASVVALLQLTNEAIRYLNDVHKAPEECQQCALEASNLQIMLMSLRFRLETGGDTIEPDRQPWFTAIRALAVKNGPFDQYRDTLKQLLGKIGTRGSGHDMKRRLLWTFNKGEAASIFQRMERLKSLISIALEMDHLQELSQAIEANMKSITTDFSSLRSKTDLIEADTSATRSTQIDQAHKDLLEWLSPTDFPSQHHDNITRRQIGTGQWFLDTLEFANWLSGSASILFCPGIPGAGKTMMASIIIDHVSQNICKQDVELSYLFCSYKGTAALSASDLLAALLKQLIQNRQDIADPVRDVHKACSERRTKPSFDQLLAAAQTVCRSYTTTYIIVDALDECNNVTRTRDTLIRGLLHLQTVAAVDLRLMFTSRFIPDITQTFQSCPTLEVKASEEDVKSFVVGQMPRLPKCVQRDADLQRVIAAKIVESVDGMFLLARLHVDSLLGHLTKKKIVTKLNTLRGGAQALEKAYTEALDRIDSQLDGDRELARLALAWITYAKRLLTTEQLCCALAIEVGASMMDRENVPDIEDVISVCLGLLVVDGESGIVRLVHYTTQEHLERVRSQWIPEAEKTIAEACLTYLMFEEYTFISKDGDDGEEEEDKAREEAYVVGTNEDESSAGASSDDEIDPSSLFSYIRRYWPEHVRSVQSDVLSLALLLLRDQDLVDYIVSARLRRTYGITGLHIAAMHGLAWFVAELLRVGSQDPSLQPDVENDLGRTPLCFAAEMGHEEVVKLLLHRSDIDVNSKDDHARQTPLLRAAKKGHETVVKALLSRKDVDASTKDEHGRTPLFHAAESGHEAVARLLLSREDVEVDSVDRFRQTPLINTTIHGHEAMIRLLISRDANVNARGTEGMTPLWCAASSGYEEVVRLLIAHGADIEHHCFSGETALSAAASEGHESVVRLLISHGADIQSPAFRGETALSAAARSGHELVVRLLISHGASVNCQNMYGMSPLSFAAQAGREAIVKLFLGRHDVLPDCRDRRGRTPLSYAACEVRGLALSLLLAQGIVDVNSRDNEGRSPLSYAAEEGTIQAVRCLVANGASAASEDSQQRTPLWWAQHGERWMFDENRLQILEFLEGLQKE